MKKVFCDCCGTEMSYDNPNLRAMVKPQTVGYKDHMFEVKIDIKPTGLATGEHLDVCLSCKWLLVDRVDPRAQPAIAEDEVDTYHSTFPQPHKRKP